MCSLDKPINYKQAFNVLGWLKDMQDKYHALVGNNTKELVSPPNNIIIIGCWWVLFKGIKHVMLHKIFIKRKV